MGAETEHPPGRAGHRVIVGVDVGGTFTDFVVIDTEGDTRRYHKVSSTPDDPGRAVIRGLEGLGVPLAEVERFVHGTTVATNTILQRDGAVTGLITTEGHRDVLEIRRGNKPERSAFDLLWSAPPPFVPRHLRLDVGGRIDYRGREVQPLDEGEVLLAADHLAAHGVEAIAICFLFSYLNASHEERAAELIEERHPDLFLSTSASILPQWREYERTVASVADAYVKPRMAAYLDELNDALARRGLARRLSIMKSNGGVMTAQSAKARPVETFLSGPAGGVVAAKYHGLQAGRPDVIAIDMGGTSFDVSVITGAEPELTTTGEIDEGTPLLLPMLDIRTIGAGGGSIAWIDPGGVLKVGPASAGADPGPASYGRGGERPTVTDANVVLGRLGRSTLLGGEMEIDPELAEGAIRRHVADPLGISVVEAAAGILRITVANMATAIRSITAEAGVDPRDYAILAGGGGGPLHAALIAEEFDISTVVVPSYPGVLSAGGLVLSDLKVDLIQSYPMRLERDGVGGLEAVMGDLIDRAVAELSEEGHQGAPVTLASLDMRYLGQNWEITVPVDPADLTVDSVAREFDRLHDKLYGFRVDDRIHEILAVRVTAVGPTLGAESLVPGRFPGAGELPEPASVRPAWDDGRGAFVDAPVYDRDLLPAAAGIEGPSVVESLDSAVWIPQGWQARVDAAGDLVMSHDPAG